MSQSTATGFNQKRIDMAVITSLEFNDQISASVPASQPDAGHGCLGATINDAHFLHRWYPVTNELRHLDFEWIRNAKAQPVGRCFLTCFHHDPRRVSENGWSPSPNKVDIFASVYIPEMGSFGLSDKEGFPSDIAESPYRRIIAARDVPARFREQRCTSLLSHGVD